MFALTNLPCITCTGSRVWRRSSRGSRRSWRWRRSRWGCTRTRTGSWTPPSSPHTAWSSGQPAPKFQLPESHSPAAEKENKVSQCFHGSQMISRVALVFVMFKANAKVQELKQMKTFCLFYWMDTCSSGSAIQRRFKALNEQHKVLIMFSRQGNSGGICLCQTLIPSIGARAGTSRSIALAERFWFRCRI